MNKNIEQGRNFSDNSKYIAKTADKQQNIKDYDKYRKSYQKEKAAMLVSSAKPREFHSNIKPNSYKRFEMSLDSKKLIDSYWNFDTFCFDENNEISFTSCGFFKSPSEDWMHLTRKLEGYELMIVTAGTLYIADDKKEYIVHPGEYLLMPPTPYQHGYKTSKCDFYWVHFNAVNYKNVIKLVDCVDNSKLVNSICIPFWGLLVDLNIVAQLVQMLININLMYNDPIYNSCTTKAILCEISNEYKKYYRDTSTTSSDRLYKSICHYVDLHITEDLRVSKIADHFGYNTKYLSHFFKEYTSISLKQMIMQKKMNIAALELQHTDLPISIIAYNLGYKDTHNFSKVFKKVMGVSPLKYRNELSIH